METQVRTPQMVFMQPQRLVVPLFQRRYVWNEENQWEPLWNDIVRVTDRVLTRPFEKHYPHFLGAVVLQQVQKQTGQMQERTIIDGQQRLATLQLLLDALHAEADRDRIIHSLGNLTLLTGKLNSKVSNGPWLGTEGKRSGLEAHDVLVLNRELLKKAVEQWTDDSIRLRTQELAGVIAQIWPVPPNHRSSVTSVQPRLHKKIDLSDLINGGALQPGMSLFPRRKKYSHKVATLLPDGQVEIDGVAFSSASDAANVIVGKTNGWWFFLTDQASRQSLQRVRRDYVNAMAVDVEEDEADDDGDEDEE